MSANQCFKYFGELKVLQPNVDTIEFESNILSLEFDKSR